MTIAFARTRAFEKTVRTHSGRVCRPSLALGLVILVAIQVVLATGAWEYPYAKQLMPDVIRTENGFSFPSQTTANDHSIGGQGGQSVGSGLIGGLAADSGESPPAPQLDVAADAGGATPLPASITAEPIEPGK
jgi:hypothetical protein